MPACCRALVSFAGRYRPAARAFPRRGSPSPFAVPTTPTRGPSPLKLRHIRALPGKIKAGNIEGAGGVGMGSPEARGLQSCVEKLNELSADLTPVSDKFAAVLVPLFEDTDGVVRVVLTQRSSKLNKHAGEVSLPGGKRDEEDADDVACAIREANEEIGLAPSDVEVITEIPPVLSKHGLSVKPVVASIPGTFAADPNPDEVSAVFDMPLHAFLEESSRHSYRDSSWGDVHYRIHFFQHGEFTVSMHAAPCPN